MTIIVRKATKDDIQIVYKMICKFAVCMKVTNGPAITLEDLYNDGGFDGGDASYFIFLAEDGDIKNSDGKPSVVGYALCMISWDGNSIFLRNMYVDESHRSKGVGNLIYKSLLRHANENKFTRIELLVPEWSSSQYFYEKLGAVNYSTKMGIKYYRIGEEIIKAIVQDE